MFEITLTVQNECTADNELMRMITVQLRKKLKQLNGKIYSDKINKIKITLRISGEFGKFRDPNGVHFISVMKNKRCASFEIVMQSDIWKKGEKAIVNFLNENCTEGLKQTAEKIKQKGIEFDTDILFDLNSIFIREKA